MTPMTRRVLTHSIWLALAATSAAQAQDAKPAAQPGSEDQTTLAKIVVTAEKRSQDIQEVPMSISVIDNQQLDNLHATQLTDYAGYLPGFTVVNGGSPGQQTLGVRGITPLSAGSTVATYIDETPIGTSSNYGAGSNSVLDLLPYDLESVELLRGPQGTLYGAVALGGVLRYVTKDPDLEQFSGQVGGDVFTTEGGDDNGYGGRLSLNMPLVPGKLAMSASYARQDSPGYTDNVRTGEEDQDSYWQDAARATMKWQASDDVSVKLQWIQSRNDSDSTSVTAIDPVSLKPQYDELENDNFVPEPYRKDVNYVNGTINWDLGWADFVSATSYSEQEQHSTLDASLVYGVIFPLFGLPDPGISAVNYDLKLYKTTQEFRLASKSDGQWLWLLGGFWTDENSKQNQEATAQFLDGSSIPGFDPLAVVGLPSTYEELAFFGNLGYKFNETFDVTGGVRFANNEQTFRQITSGALTGESNVPGDSDEDVTTWSLTSRAHLAPDQMLYLRVATGYQPGGPNLALPGVPPTVDSSELINYEFGWKALLSENRWSVDLAVFDIEWEDIQISDSVNGLAFLANGGTARSRGVEFSTAYAPFAGMRLGLNGAYIDAELTEDVPSLGGLDGDALPETPEWSWSATADYVFPAWDGWTARVGGGLRYIGDRFSGVESNGNAFEQDSYTVVDLNTDVSSEHWTVRLYVKNLFDERSYGNLTVLPNAATGETMKVNGVPNLPRTIGIGFDYRF